MRRSASSSFSCSLRQSRGPAVVLGYVTAPLEQVLAAIVAIEFNLDQRRTIVRSCFVYSVLELGFGAYAAAPTVAVLALNAETSAA